MEETNTGISRRTALKRIGVGAAVVWTAPMVMSIETPAFAASPVCTNCSTLCPRGDHICGPGHSCLIHQDPSGGCVCVHASYCGQSERAGNNEPPNAILTCNRDADCNQNGATGYVCAVTCCPDAPTNRCVPTFDPGSATAATTLTTNSTTGWDIAGYYRCQSTLDCTSVSGAGFTTCGSVNGVSVCQ